VAVAVLNHPSNAFVCRTKTPHKGKDVSMIVRINKNLKKAFFGQNWKNPPESFFWSFAIYFYFISRSLLFEICRDLEIADTSTVSQVSSPWNPANTPSS